ncbi:MAG: (2Fe-2S)-binding protein [Myxococcales bacterium]|nr:(2Fe-2S)-binding protein [Myxococcales bacterium]
MPKVTFKKNRVLPKDYVLEAEPGKTILEIAQAEGIPIGANCGGVCGCSTCHIYVVKGFDSLDEMEDREEDRLDLGFDVRLNSRLGCQARTSSEDLMVDVTEESLKAFFDENPKIRKHYEATGELLMVPHSH